MLNTLLSSQFDSWVSLSSLKSSPIFSILADECEDISTKEDLTIRFRWIINGKPEEQTLLPWMRLPSLMLLALLLNSTTLIFEE